ncbi:MAG: hypothetical protein ABIC04_03745 [Nanoarchaeota archaeon]
MKKNMRMMDEPWYIGPEIFKNTIKEVFGIASQISQRPDHKVLIGVVDKIENRGGQLSLSLNETVNKEINSGLMLLLRTFKDGFDKSQLTVLTKLCAESHHFPIKDTGYYITPIDFMTFSPLSVIDYALASFLDASSIDKEAKSRSNEHMARLLHAYISTCAKYDFGNTSFYEDVRRNYAGSGLIFDRTADQTLYRYLMTINNREVAKANKKTYESYKHLRTKENELGILDLITLTTAAYKSALIRLAAKSERASTLHQAVYVLDRISLPIEVSKHYLHKAETDGTVAMVTELKQIVESAYKEDKPVIEIIGSNNFQKSGI